MAKFITLKRKYLVISGLVVVVVIAGILGANLLRDAETSLGPEQVAPEMKIISLEFEPQIIIRDQTYGGEVFKGVQIMPKTNFKVSALVQNMTEQTVNNIPVKLTISSLGDNKQQMVKEGSIPTLEPGATAKISFENIKALGDAKGESVTAGQHEMVLAINANAQGGLAQNTEARLIFTVDSSVQ